jgi:hypothetical protein
LAALVALGLAVAMWPRLGERPPRLPPATAEPLGGAGGVDVAAPGGAGRPARRRAVRVAKRGAVTERGRVPQRRAVRVAKGGAGLGVSPRQGPVRHAPPAPLPRRVRPARPGPQPRPMPANAAADEFGLP